jgi:VIT1/CCC1 family predicted Fe2+/Mn2+ transporter
MKVKPSFKTGFSFGLTSGVITTLGLMVGLNSGTHSQIAVIGGILTIAIADASSDALGIHIAEEAKDGKNEKHIWEATLATFFSKLLFALTFILPVLLLPLSTAIIVSVAWGLLLLAVFSFVLGKQQEGNPWKAVLEHLVIALLVILATHLLGEWIGQVFV